MASIAPPMPADWSGTVLLWSHGYRPAGFGSKALNARAATVDPATPVHYVSYRPTPYPRPYDLAHRGDRHQP